MTTVGEGTSAIAAPDRIFIGGKWVKPSSDSMIDVIDSNTEELFLRVAEAKEADVNRAVESARDAFDNGPWPRLSHLERAGYMRAMAQELRKRASVVADAWPREAGILYSAAVASSDYAPSVLDFFADMAEDYPWEELAQPEVGEFGLLVREPVGVVGAIVPWNGPLHLGLQKIAPAMLAGCTIILKSSPEAPAAAYVIAEAAEAAGLPAGVLNMVTADRGASEALVRNHGVDKIAFTGSTAAGRRIATIMADRIGRYTLELGGKSAAVLLDDADLVAAAETIALQECGLSGQVCSSLTRIIVQRDRHDEFAGLLADAFSQKRVGDAFDASSDLGPLAIARQRDRVESYIAKGLDDGARLLTGGKRPAHLDRGYYIEPTVFANVDNSSTIAQEEIFGPVLSVIPADSEEHAIKLANDTIFGLNASVFTPDVDRARGVARRLRSGTVGHNDWRTDFTIAFGGVKQSGIGREGGREGLHAYLETKTIVLDGPPAGYKK